MAIMIPRIIRPTPVSRPHPPSHGLRGTVALGLAMALSSLTPLAADGQDAKPGAADATVRASAPLVRADANPLEKEFVIRERLDVFFKGIGEEKVEKAFADLLEGSKIGEKKENLDGLVKSTLGVLAKFGRLNDFEMIRAKRVGSRTVRFSYLSYGPDFPLLWNFYCYRGGDEWQILDITVNNDPDQIFDEEPEATPAP